MSASFNAFLSGACEGRDGSTRVRVLYAAYTAFCRGRHFLPVERVKFGRLLTKRGLPITMDSDGATWVSGLGVIDLAADIAVPTRPVLVLPSGLSGSDLTALSLVAAELARQRAGEGFSAAHDDAHDPGDLEMAGGCYLLNAGTDEDERGDFPTAKPCDLWPWENRWWKPASRVRDAVRGSALGVAGIAARLRAGERAEG
ncbi:hypothetical protein ABMY26_36435 (plasmid) [Azospirillum sp. HJ39]|uniref:hypothetical protein n=1 Tax=Azospirillum sp. HJ39 TaxID=3159496 RepID=UPI003558E2D7